MAKKRGRFVRVRQKRGFTLANVAAIVVASAAGIGAAKAGYGFFDDNRHHSLYQSFQSVENQYWDFRDIAGRWPGDCNRDHVIGYHPENSVHDDSNLSVNIENVQCQNDYQVENYAAIAADFTSRKLKLTKTLSSVVTDSITVQAGHGEINNKSYNVIVYYGVTARDAQWLDKEIDGVTSGQLGRIRRWDAGDVGSQWPANAEDKVAVAYYFDKIAP